MIDEATESAIRKAVDEAVNDKLLEINRANASEALLKQLHELRDGRESKPGLPVEPEASVLITVFIPSDSKFMTITPGLQRTWMKNVMALFSKHFEGATRLGGLHDGLWSDKNDKTTTSWDFPIIVQTHAAESELKPAVLDELGDFMFGMATELKQFSTMLVVAGYRLFFENKDPEQAAGNIAKLEARGRSGSLDSWPFMREALYEEVQQAFNDGDARRPIS